MRQEQRRTKRKPLRHVAWLATAKDKPRTACLLSDISESGARIEVENARELPDGFLLLLSRTGVPSRWCRLVWRSKRQVGVRFEKLSRAQGEEMLRRNGRSAAAQARPSL